MSLPNCAQIPPLQSWSLTQSGHLDGSTPVDPFPDCPLVLPSEPNPAGVVLEHPKKSAAVSAAADAPMATASGSSFDIGTSSVSVTEMSRWRHPSRRMSRRTKRDRDFERSSFLSAVSCERVRAISSAPEKISSWCLTLRTIAARQFVGHARDGSFPHVPWGVVVHGRRFRSHVQRNRSRCFRKVRAGLTSRRCQAARSMQARKSYVPLAATILIAFAGCAVGVSPSSGGGAEETDGGAGGQTGSTSYGNDGDAGSQHDSGRKGVDASSPASTSTGSATSDPTSTCAPPDTPADCTCASGHTCAANNCYGGYLCDTSTNRCKAPSACP